MEGFKSICWIDKKKSLSTKELKIIIFITNLCWISIFKVKGYYTRAKTVKIKGNWLIFFNISSENQFYLGSRETLSG